MTWEEELNDFERKTERGMWWVRLDMVRELIKKTREDAYKEGLKENIENLEKTSDKYKTLFWCIREDAVREALEQVEEEITLLFSAIPYKNSPNALKHTLSIIQKHKNI
ncbi:MAG: hypothetical protein WC803_12830 [Sphingomonas sp.]|jgi:hypothetical protein